MKKLSTLFFALIAMSLFATAAPNDDLRRGYENSFIFQEGGIEFAIFPDGQFDFNYLEQVSRVDFIVNTPAVSISYNSGYDYDAYVQYDTYGAVIQIENTPIYYDEYGRISQAGNVFINYRNGYVNRVGNLNVFYRRPGVILRTSGFINTFNRYYVYQPWHGFYGVPLVDRCIVWNNPYRLYYNPIRYDWSYHRVNWNRPYYYNGCYSDFALRRSFYRPYDRVEYQSFERGRRDTRGRLITDRNVVNSRAAIATGRRDVTRDRSAYTAADRNASFRSTAGRETATASRNYDASTGRNSSRGTSSLDSNRSTGRTAGVVNTNTQSSESTRTNRTESLNTNTRSSSTRSTRNEATVSSRESNVNTARSINSNVPRAERTTTRTMDREPRNVQTASMQRTERSAASTPQRAVRTTPTVAAPQRTQRSTPSVTPQRNSQRSTPTAAPSRSTESKSRSTNRSSSRSSGRG